jgi:hypothetical protein
MILPIPAELCKLWIETGIRGQGRGSGIRD